MTSNSIIYLPLWLKLTSKWWVLNFPVSFLLKAFGLEFKPSSIETPLLCSMMESQLPSPLSLSCSSNICCTTVHKWRHCHSSAISYFFLFTFWGRLVVYILFWDKGGVCSLFILTFPFYCCFSCFEKDASSVLVFFHFIAFRNKLKVVWLPIKRTLFFRSFHQDNPSPLSLWQMEQNCSYARYFSHLIHCRNL